MKKLLLILTLIVSTVSAQTSVYYTAYKSYVYEKNSYQTEWNLFDSNSDVYIPISITNNIISITAKSSTTIRIDRSSIKNMSGYTNDKSDYYEGYFWMGYDIVKETEVGISIAKYQVSGNLVMNLNYNYDNKSFLITYYLKRN